MKRRTSTLTILMQPFCPEHLRTTLLGLFLLALVLSPAMAGAISISDSPMETLVQAAPPNIMFVLDDSGSMDWEFMTEETDGKFGSYEYLFDDAGNDNTYDPSDGNGTILSGVYRKRWKSQWYGYNKIFYNPNVNYTHWPGMSDASTTTPRCNPYNETPTLNLGSTYTALKALSGPVIIVDNTTNTGNPYATTGNFYTTGTWSESSHSPEYLDSSLYCDATSGTSQAFWTPQLADSGDYGVYVWFACDSGANRDSSAVYTVNDASGVPVDYTVNQMGGDAGNWYFLGTHNFNSQDANWPVPNEIVVDDNDGSPAFVLTGSWSQSGATPEYLNSSRFSGSTGSTATWTPTILEAGEYEVWFYWTSGEGWARDTGAQYVVHDGNGTDTEYTVDQTADYGQWNYMGTHTFNAGTGGYVKLTRITSIGNTACDAVKFVKVGAQPPDPQYIKLTRGTTDSSYATSADAVMLVPPGSSYDTINVNNAHYYMIDDTNGNGAHDTGEDVWLVNFENGTRKYYLTTLSGESVDDDIEELTPPAAIKPKVYSETGTYVRDVTDAEDLQNFANWYSFYRRRELTSKAAVSNVINELEGVNVGFYSINSTTTSGLRQSVLKIKLDSGADVIVDNLDSFSTTGTWGESGSPNEYKDSSKYTNTDGGTATWTASLHTAGTYKVHVWYNCYSGRNNNAEYVILDGGTELATVYQNQRQETGNVCGEWVELGTYTFATTSASVQVVHHEGNGSTVADAVYFQDTSGTTVNVDESSTLLTALYSLESDGNTPLRSAFENVGQYYDATDSDTGNLGDSPFASAADGGACQHSFAILMTDGFYNGSAPSVGNVDSGMAAPYGDAYENTLADLAMKYYNKDLSTLDDLVPTNSCDEKETQHMVTYAVSFGVSGTQSPEDLDGDGKEDDPCFLNSSTTLPVWPNPASGNPQKIDDLWHAAVNGRGQFFSADDPEELVSSLESLFENIASRTASGASVSVNGEELGSNTTLYQAIYSSDNWTGDIYAYPLNAVSGEVNKTESAIKWKASGKSGDPNGLQQLDWDSDRKIITYNNMFNAGGSAVPFRLSHLSDGQKTALDADWATDSTEATNMLNYIRGKEVTGFRTRNRKLGDIVHSAPLLKNNTLYAGANDGMLHAFDKETGRERFAYIPNLVFSNLALLANPLYSHQFYVDGTPSSQVQGAISGGTSDILVCGLGKGGMGYFALDITDADTITAGSTETAIASDIGLWEFPDAATSAAHISDMGYSFSLAHIVKAKVSGAEKWVVIFGNGYNSPDSSAVLFVLDALDGTVVAKIDTGVAGGNGLSTPAVVDADNDFMVDYVYAGDLMGNMWKFDLTDPDPAAWGVAYKDGSTNKPLFSATDQPITARPDVMWHPSKNGFIVIFGTGKYFDNSDRDDTSQQSIYGIWDYGDDDDDSEYLGTVNHVTGTLSYPSGISLVKQTVTDTRSVNGDFYRTFSNNQVRWYQQDAYGNDLPLPADTDEDQNPNPVVHAGWFFDFPNTGDYSGERVIKDVNIRNDMAIVLSFIPNNSPCSGGGNSFFYCINAETGGYVEDPAMDVNGDGKLGDPDLIQIGTDDEGEPIYAAPTGVLNVGMLHAPKFLKVTEDLDKVIMSDSSGDIPVVDIVGESLGMYYWIER